MAKIQDVDIPYLEFAEGAAPSTPAAAITRLYAKADGLLYSKDDAGVETSVSGAGTAVFHGARAYHSTTQTVASAATTAMVFNSERFDTSGIHDTGSNTGRLTADTTGYWHIGANIFWATVTATKESWVGLRMDGTTYLAIQSVTSVAASNNIVNVTTIYPLTATHYVEVMVFNAESGTITIATNANAEPEFWAYLIGT